MGAEQIHQILTKLDALEESQNKLLEIVEKTLERLSHLETVTVKNGGGREVSYQRDQFAQMIYDRGKEAFNNFSDKAKKLNSILEVAWKLATVVALVVAAIKIGV